MSIERNKIYKEIADKTDEIIKLQTEIRELENKNFLLSDKCQWFTEKTKTKGRVFILHEMQLCSRVTKLCKFVNRNRNKHR